MKKYVCKRCGAELYFDPTMGKLHCEYCDSTFDPSEFPDETAEGEGKDQVVEQGLSEEEIQAAKDQGMTDQQAQAFAGEDAESTDDSEGDLVVYSCPNCGAQVITSKDTVATT
ncbi:MAG: hypothetical protein KBS83_05270, partial [Lachnospiraceae bacterium]|nr:hypothetical protein [Candidatus Equihabitans merdae]